MLVLRPARESDLPGLIALAQTTGGGLTTLPPNAEFLEERIEHSRRSFATRVRQPGGEYYLFALEDLTSHEVVGVSGLAARVGGFEPWYSYEIRNEGFVHAPLRFSRNISVLHLRREHRGPSEICSLFLRGDRRRSGAGRVLSLGRLLFATAFRQRFTETVIAELRGYLDPRGQSPFWEAVGRHFYPFDFYRADVMSGLGDKQFIADLNPRHPLYIPLLPSEVEATIGRVHHETEPARALLLKEGFEPTREIDIFDAGPLLAASFDRLRTIRLSRTARVRSAAAPEPAKATALLANRGIDFRVCQSDAVTHADGSVSLDPKTAAALQVEAGDRILISPLR